MTTRILFVLIAIAVLFSLLVRESSPSFQKCVLEIEQQSVVANETFPLFYRVVAPRCTGQFVDANNAGITAVATVLLTMITFGLIWTGYQQIVTSRLQLRAYVFADNVTLGEGSILTPPRPDKINVPGVFLSWKNTGQTPARNVVSWAKIEVIEPINEGKLVVPTLGKHFPNNIGAGGYSNKALWYDRALTPAEIADVNGGARAIYLYGRIEYEDIFGEEYFTNFRLAYTGQFPPLQNVIFQFCTGGNEAS